MARVILVIFIFRTNDLRVGLADADRFLPIQGAAHEGNFLGGVHVARG